MIKTVDIVTSYRDPVVAISEAYEAITKRKRWRCGSQMSVKDKKSANLPDMNPVMLVEQIEEDLFLRRDEGGLFLTDGNLVVRGELEHMLPRLKQSNLQGEMLVKAIRIKGYQGNLQVLDATAGLGEDSLLLAGAGFYVNLYEYNHVIASLLGDAIERAKDHPVLGPIVSRMILHEGDSIAAMKRLCCDTNASHVHSSQMKEEDSGWKPDVILLDPMFPAREKSALIKKKFQLLQRLESPCNSEEELFQAAKSVGSKKIVVKRPLKGPYLAEEKPDYSYTGKAIRYDCYVN